MPKHDTLKVVPLPENQTPAVDEHTGVMIYGNLKIIDVQSNEILINKRA